MKHILGIISKQVLSGMIVCSFLNISKPASAQKTRSAESYLESAKTHVSELDWKDACSDLDEAIRIKPDFAEAYVLRAAINSIFFRKPDNVINDCNEAIHLGADSAIVFFYRGLAYRTKAAELAQEKKYAEAILYCEKALADFDEAARKDPPSERHNTVRKDVEDLLKGLKK